MDAQIPPVKLPDSASIRADRVRLVIVLYRKQGTSAEEFHKYWREEHSRIFAGIAIVKRNLLKYEQIHCHNDALTAFKNDSLPVADYDGLAIFDAVSFDKIREVFEDKEYNEVVVPDEEKFLDRKRALVWPSQIVDIFDDPT